MTFSASNICGINFHYVRYPLIDFLNHAGELELERVEIWGAAPHFYVGDESIEGAQRLKAALKVRDLKLVCFTPEQGVYPINLASRDRSLRYFLDCLDMCVEMESPNLLVTPGSGYVNEEPGLAWRRCSDALRILATRAERLGVDLLLEPLPPAYSDIITTAGQLRRMIDELSSPAVNGMMDTASAVIVNETIRDYADQLGNKLRHIHMIDADSAGSHLAWGEGTLPLHQYLNDIEAVGYKGALSLEFTGSRYFLDPYSPMRRSAEQLRNALG